MSHFIGILSTVYLWTESAYEIHSEDKTKTEYKMTLIKWQFPNLVQAKNIL